jgi:hypothetical protein
MASVVPLTALWIVPILARMITRGARVVNRLACPGLSVR